MSQPVTYTGVVAMAPDRGIGCRGALPWHLPDDLKTFKRITHLSISFPYRFSLGSDKYHTKKA